MNVVVTVGLLGLLGLGWALAGCGDKADAPAAKNHEVVVYTALDRHFSEPILNDFTAKTGIKVRPVYDTESTKTVGLVNRIRQEAKRPRCDVFWNNEILNTLRLKSEDLLQPCDPPQAKHYPPQYRDPDRCWYGFAARARVIIVNTKLVKPHEMPTSVRDLANPRWRDQVGIAKPLFGTTASHVACLFAKLGGAGAKELLASFKANGIQVVAGNKTCAEMVASGQLAFGLTDTDDAVMELEAGKPVRIVFPDAAEGGMGTLLLPNTLAVVKGAPHAEAAGKLIEYLLSPEVEARLAEGPSAQIPLHSQTRVESRACRLAELRQMRVDFADAARQFASAADYIEGEFLD
ncbi:MAG: extracellular solute-binding protein [Phycisphaerae bacterium]|nr:extracellular solute-binding protein [Phycisphaerae bacterium]